MSGTPRRAIAAGCVLALLALAGPPSPASAARSPSAGAGTAGVTGTRFVVGTTQDIDSLNPFKGVVQTAYEAGFLIYDTLTGWSPQDLSPAQTGLATSWEPSTDGKTWTYHLHQGVTWSDGQPLTAKDVVYTFNRILGGELERAAYEAYVSTITKVSAPDDTTVVIETSEPTPVMEQLWVPILPEHIWKDIPEDKVADFENRDPVGSGPFSLVEYKPTEYLLFTANKKYFQGAPKVDQVELRVFANEEAMTLALRSGDIDLAHDLPATQFDALKGVAGITTVASKTRDFSEIGFNVGAATVDGQPIGDGHPALADARVRQAIAHAIDRKTLVEKVLNGYGDPGTTVIPPIYSALHYEPGASEYAFDLAAANKILDEAGYAKGTDGIRRAEFTGRKLSFRLYGRQGKQASEQTVQFVAGWLKQIGIETTVKIVSEDQLTTWIGEGNYDIFEWGWGVEPDPNFQLSVFTCDQRSIQDGGEISAGWSDSFYCNPDYDKLYNEQKITVDRTKRAELVKQMQQLLYQDTPYVLTYYGQTLEAYRSDRFTNLQRQPASSGSLVYQFGAYTYRLVTPVSASAAKKSGGPGAVLLLGLGGAVLVIVLVAFTAVFFRRRTADVRE